MSGHLDGRDTQYGLIAVGAVTGTVLSLEMGLLWPEPMRQYGAVLGVPLGVEGLFFCLEAIFAGIYLWAGGPAPPSKHVSWCSGLFRIRSAGGGRR